MLHSPSNGSTRPQSIEMRMAFKPSSRHRSRSASAFFHQLQAERRRARSGFRHGVPMQPTDCRGCRLQTDAPRSTRPRESRMESSIHAPDGNSLLKAITRNAPADIPHLADFDYSSVKLYPRPAPGLGIQLALACTLYLWARFRVPAIGHEPRLLIEERGHFGTPANPTGSRQKRQVILIQLFRSLSLYLFMLKEC